MEGLTTHILKRMFGNDHRMSLLIDFLYRPKNDDNTITINQVAHGFNVKQAIRDTGTQYVLSQANNETNAHVDGIVVQVVDDDNFKYLKGGLFVHDDWIANTEYFLSPDTPGLVTSEPENWNIGEVRKSLGSASRKGLNIEIDSGFLIDDYFLTLLLDNAANATVDDADTFNFIKAAALKKITWVNIKATLKTYFDTIYSTFSGSWNDLTDKPSTFPPSAHNHMLSEITDSGSIADKGFWLGTQAEYDAIGTKDSNTIYHIKE